MRTIPSRKLVVGLMSGTSADGIDAALVDIHMQHGFPRAHLIKHIHKPFDASTSSRIFSAGLAGSVSEICELNFLLGERFAQATLDLLRQAKVSTAQVSAIGSHGQTVQHLPNARHPSTLQIGEPAVIAERTGILTVADFRTRDMAAGGQGAPLVPFADYALFADSARPRIVQNIGGIANLTFLPPGGSLSDVVAFDTGPGNMVMDACASQVTKGRIRCDVDGKLAAAGTVCESLLHALLRHPFFRRRPPKTTGREQFGAQYVRELLILARKHRLSPQDLLATVTALTAETIARAYRSHVFPMINPKVLDSLQVILGGGGASNPVLCRMLRERMGHGELLSHASFGVPNEAKEALAFAVLAYQTLRNMPGNVPRATGARRAVILGKIVPA